MLNPLIFSKGVCCFLTLGKLCFSLSLLGTSSPTFPISPGGCSSCLESGESVASCTVETMAFLSSVAGQVVPAPGL